MRRRLVTGCIIINDKKQVLLFKKPKNQGVYPDHWSIPGGGVENNETIINSLEREVTEEIGVKN